MVSFGLLGGEKRRVKRDFRDGSRSFYISWGPPDIISDNTNKPSAKPTCAAFPRPKVSRTGTRQVLWSQPKRRNVAIYTPYTPQECKTTVYIIVYLYIEYILSNTSYCCRLNSSLVCCTTKQTICGKIQKVKGTLR